MDERISTLEPLPIVCRHVPEFIIAMLEHRHYCDCEETLYNRVMATLKDECLGGLAKYIVLFFGNTRLSYDLINELKVEDDSVTCIKSRLDLYEQCISRVDCSDSVYNITKFYALRHLNSETFHQGYGRFGHLILRKTSDTQDKLRKSMPNPSKDLKKFLYKYGLMLNDLKLLLPDWSSLIGHNCHMDIHLMMRDLGWWSGPVMLLTYRDRIANRYYLELFEKRCPLLIRGENIPDHLWFELASLTPFIGVSQMYWSDMGGRAIQLWEEQGRSWPLLDAHDHKLARRDEYIQYFNKLRREWGMSEFDWHVCLHVRDTDTRERQKGFDESNRSASVSSYIDAINFIISQGGWVIRMGGPKAQPLPPMDRLIDYAHSPKRMPFMDIHLVRMARMFIGTTSGFSYVPTCFGIPSAIVNAISPVSQLWTSKTRFSLKPIYRKTDGLVRQKELTSDVRWALATAETLNYAGLTVKESSSDEILETVKEVYSLISDGNYPISSRLEAWGASVSHPGFYGSSKPSSYFLDKYDSFCQ